MLGVVTFEHSQYLGIGAGCWAETLEFEGSLKTDTIVGSSEDLLSRILWNCVLQYTDSVKTIVFCRYYLLGAENVKVTLLPWMESFYAS
jgi:hypothetical protein